jgi:hypothetical protein
MKFSTFAIIAGLTVLSASGAHAQGQDQFAFGIAGGATFPSGPGKDYHTTGAHGTVMWGIGGIDSPFGVRFDGMYSSLGHKDDAAGEAQGSARVTSISGNLLFRVLGTDKRLYALGGVGGFAYNPDGPGTKAKNDFGINAGLGVWIPGVNAFIEARWFNLYRALPDPNTGNTGKRSLRIYPVSLGFMY